MTLAKRKKTDGTCHDVSRARKTQRNDLFSSDEAVAMAAKIERYRPYLESYLATFLGTKSKQQMPINVSDVSTGPLFNIE